MVEINDIICRKCVAFYIILPQTHDYNKKKSFILIHNIENGNTFSTQFKTKYNITHSNVSTYSHLRAIQLNIRL